RDRHGARWLPAPHRDGQRRGGRDPLGTRHRPSLGPRAYPAVVVQPRRSWLTPAPDLAAIPEPAAEKTSGLPLRRLPTTFGTRCDCYLRIPHIAPELAIRRLSIG